MVSYVDSATLKDVTLMLKQLADNDYSLRAGELTAGRIMLGTISGARAAWLWTITGPDVPQELQPSHGTSETLDEAMAAFKSKYDAWLAWATALEQQVE